MGRTPDGRVGPARGGRGPSEGVVPTVVDDAAAGCGALAAESSSLDVVPSLPESATPSGSAPVPSGEGQIRSGRLAGKSLRLAIALLAAPVFLDQLLSATVGLADKVLTGGLPEGATAALDGVGAGSYVGWFLGIALSSVGIGSLAIIARAMGRGETREAALGLGQALLAAVVWGLVIAGFLLVGAPGLAKVAGLAPEAAAACVSYVRSIALGVPFMAVLLVGMMSLHGAGEAIRPFFIMLVVNVVNVIASWLLSGAHFGWFGLDLDSPGRLGVAGIGLGTAIAHTVGALLLVALLLRGVKDLRLEGWALRPRVPMLARIVRVGLPAFLDGAGVWIGNIVVIAIVGKIAAAEGAAAGGPPLVGLLGAHIIAIQWEAFSFLPGFAMGTAAATLVGQYLGAGNARMATRSVWACAAVAALFMSAAALAFLFAGDFLTRQISRDPLHLELVPQLLFIAGCIQPAFAIAMVLREAIRGAGDTRWAMAINWGSTFLVRVPLSYVVGYTMGHGLVGVWVVLCGEIVVRAFLLLARFLHGGWRRVTV